MTGAQFNDILGLKAKHALYFKAGDWYHQLKMFPGVLFDANGYLIVPTKRQYDNNHDLQKKKDLHIKNGISSLRGYRKFSSSERSKISFYLKDKKSKKESVTLVPERKVARIVYNTNSWASPSGWLSKSKNKNTHEGKFGFGYDEWLFSFDSPRNNFHYGFIEGIYNGFNKHKGRIYDIQLFTIDSLTKTKYWVGKISRCQVLTDIEYNAFIAKGGNGHHSRVQQLKAIGLYSGRVKRDFKATLACVKFKKEDVKLFEPLIPIIGNSFMKTKWRYKLYDWQKDAVIKTLVNSEFVFSPSGPNGIVTVVRAKSNPPAPKEIKQLHRQIAEGLYKSLVKEFQRKNIGCDCSTGGGTYIDMVRKLKNSFVFYEIKTYRDIRKNVREAFGQLMEYAYWKCNKKIVSMIIVSDSLPDENLKGYFKFLRSNFKIPVFYQQFNLSNGKLSRLF
jgi:hypothetical protein